MVWVRYRALPSEDEMHYYDADPRALDLIEEIARLGDASPNG
jgi:hypothetical protein